MVLLFVEPGSRRRAKGMCYGRDMYRTCKCACVLRIEIKIDDPSKMAVLILKRVVWYFCSNEFKKLST